MSTFTFGSTSNAAQAPSSSVPSFSFTGASSTNTPAAGSTPAPFSFGNTAAAPAAQAPAAGSSLFGGAASTQTQSQPASGGFSFGAKPAQPAAGSTGLFGQSTNTAQPSTGLFGQTAQPAPSGSNFFGQAQQQPQQQTTSLFGQPQQQQQQPTGTSLFGQSNQQQPSTGLFGQQPQQGSTSLFGSQQPAQQQQSSLQASTSGTSGQSGVSKTTKFSELPEQYQKKVEELDSWIKQQKSTGQGINNEDLGKAIWRTTTDIKSSTEESTALTQSLQNTARALTSLQSRFVTEEEDVRRLAEIWETYKAVDGRPGAMRVAGHREWPAEFFGRVARGLEERAGRYKATIAQLNRVVVGLTSESETPSPQAIAQTIHNHQNALVTLAAQLESLQVRMNGLKTAYAAEYRDRTNSMRDPFDVAREDKGMAPVRA